MNHRDLKRRVLVLKQRFNAIYQALDAKGMAGYGPGSVLFEARGDLQQVATWIGRRKHSQAVKVIERLEKEWPEVK